MSKTIAVRKSNTSYLMSSLFILANISLPHLFHMIPGGGIMFLPIYFFTAFAAVCYGKWNGILTAVMSPAIGYLMFGMPRISLLPDMILKGIMLSVVLAYLMTKVRTITARIIAVPLGVATAWIIAGLMELPILNYEMAFQDFFTGIPGLLFMTLAGWIALFFNKRMAS